MVCARCIDVARAELTKAGFNVLDVQLGQATLAGPLQTDDLIKIEQVLTQQGFGLIQEQHRTESTYRAARQSTHQRAKAFIDMFFSQDDLSETNGRLSVQLQDALGLDYHIISSQFAKVEGITLEKYSIGRRIDKVKEWLVYSDLSLTEIAHRTGYSSVQHLSNQFRQQTGLTPSYFRQIRQQKKALQTGEPPEKTQVA
jgi:AraC family transcriptional regulator